MSSFSTIRTNLQTDLDAVVTGGTISCALFGRRIDFTGFPAVRYYIDGISNELLAAGGGVSAQYRRGYVFRIDVCQQKETKSPEQAELDLGAAVDAVCDKLETNWNLGSAGDLLTAPESQQVVELETANGIMVIVPIIVSIRTLSP